MSAKQLLDPRWHWLRQALNTLYDEIDQQAKPICLTMIVFDETDMVSYSAAPDYAGVDKRIITSPSALMEAAEATTVSANVDEGGML